MIVAGVWTGAGLSNLKKSGPGSAFKKFETGVESESEKVTPVSREISDVCYVSVA